jgi:hypothetical protein
LNQEIVRLIGDGLNGDNLRRLVTECEGISAQNPTLYVTLALIFSTLEAEYGGQAIPTDRYQRINAALQKPILDLIASAGGPAEVFPARMDEVLRNFMAVRA